MSANIKGGINHGLTPTEVREIIIHLCGYRGFPKTIDAMAIANQVFVDMGLASTDDKLAPAKQMDLEERRRLGSAALSRVTGGALPADPQ